MLKNKCDRAEREISTLLTNSVVQCVTERRELGGSQQKGSQQGSPSGKKKKGQEKFILKHFSSIGVGAWGVDHGVQDYCTGSKNLLLPKILRRRGEEGSNSHK